MSQNPAEIFKNKHIMEINLTFDSLIFVRATLEHRKQCKLTIVKSNIGVHDNTFLACHAFQNSSFLVFNR